MTITNDTTTTLAERLKAVDLDDRIGELPDEIRTAPITENLIEQCIAWLKAHPPVPAWLNLDGYCPPEIREELLHTTETLEELLRDGALEYACMTAYAIAVLYEDTVSIDGVNADKAGLDAVTGYSRFRAALQKVSDMVEAATGEGPNYDEVTWFHGYHGDDAKSAAAAILEARQ